MTTLKNTTLTSNLVKGAIPQFTPLEGPSPADYVASVVDAITKEKLSSPISTPPSSAIKLTVKMKETESPLTADSSSSEKTSPLELKSIEESADEEELILDEDQRITETLEMLRQFILSEDDDSTVAYNSKFNTPKSPKELQNLLIEAIKRGDEHLPTIEYLAQRLGRIHLNLIKSNNTQQPALMVACVQKNPSLNIINCLIQNGADIFGTDNYGNNVLQVMCMLRKPKIVACLLQEKSVSVAEKFIEFFHAQFMVGHINNLRKHGKMDFAGSPPGTGAHTISTMLGKLQKDLSPMLPDGHLPVLTKAFQNASTLAFDKKSVADIQKGELVILPRGYDGHSMYLVFYKGYMAICNTENAKGIDAVTVCKIDPSKFTEETLNTLAEMDGEDADTASTYYYKTLASELAPAKEKKPIKDAICAQLEKSLTPKKKQKIGNCEYSGAKLATRLAAAMLNIKADGSVLSEQAIKQSIEFSKTLSTHTRLYFLNNYYAYKNAQFLSKSNPLAKFSDFAFNPNVARDALKKAVLHLGKTKVLITDYPLVDKAYVESRQASS